MERAAGTTLATPTRRATQLAVAGVVLALLMLGSFYAIVAAAVDRGERRAFAVDQSDIDEDLRTPARGNVLSVRAAAPR